MLAGKTNTALNQLYDAAHAGGTINKYELLINAGGFLRYRKFYRDGKQEYFSFNARRLTDVGYFGTVKNGELVFYTKSADVIVQTFNSRQGDVDSMAAALRLPVKMIEPEDILKIRENLIKMKQQLIEDDPQPAPPVQKIINR